MDEFLLDGYKKLLQLNLDKQYVQDLIEVINSGDSSFSKTIINSKRNIASLYKLRFKIAKERKILSEAYLQNYESCVLNLANSKEEFIGINSIRNTDNNFLIFHETETKVILGILKFDI